MGAKIVALMFVVFGILDFAIGLPFPNTMLLLVVTSPPHWVSWIVGLGFPILCVIFGLALWFKLQVGRIALGVLSIIYAILHLWTIPNLGFWRYVSSDYFPTLHASDFSVFGGAILFIATAVYLLLVCRPPNNSLEPDADKPRRSS